MTSGPRRRSAAEWQALIEEWKKSGKTREEFAGSKGLIVRTFVWWISELDRRARGARMENTPAVPFLPVRVVTETSSELIPVAAASAATASLELVLGSGRTLRVPVGADTSWLARVVVALEGAG